MPVFSLRCVLLLSVMAVPGLAHAHPGHHAMDGLLSGLAHPVFGLDHLLAMLAVGLWGAQLGERARWLLPVLFVGVMLIGGVLGMLGVSVPLVEPGIIASVVVLGLFLLWARQVPLLLCGALVSLFALFHGLAHGAEMPVQVSALSYASGFALATAGLHLAGLALALWVQGCNRAHSLRFAGALLGLAGLGLLLG